LEPVTVLNCALIVRLRPAAQRQDYSRFAAGCNGTVTRSSRR